MPAGFRLHGNGVPSLPDYRNAMPAEDFERLTLLAALGSPAPPWAWSNDDRSLVRVKNPDGTSRLFARAYGYTDTVNPPFTADATHVDAYIEIPADTVTEDVFYKPNYWLGDHPEVARTAKLYVICRGFDQGNDAIAAASKNNAQDILNSAESPQSISGAQHCFDKMFPRIPDMFFGGAQPDVEIIGESMGSNAAVGLTWLLRQYQANAPRPAARLRTMLYDSFGAGAAVHSLVEKQAAAKDMVSETALSEFLTHIVSVIPYPPTMIHEFPSDVNIGNATIGEASYYADVRRVRMDFFDQHAANLGWGAGGLAMALIAHMQRRAPGMKPIPLKQLEEHLRNPAPVPRPADTPELQRAPRKFGRRVFVKSTAGAVAAMGLAAPELGQTVGTIHEDLMRHSPELMLAGLWQGTFDPGRDTYRDDTQLATARDLIGPSRASTLNFPGMLTRLLFLDRHAPAMAQGR